MYASSHLSAVPHTLPHVDIWRLLDLARAHALPDQHGRQAGHAAEDERTQTAARDEDDSPAGRLGRREVVGSHGYRPRMQAIASPPEMLVEP